MTTNTQPRPAFGTVLTDRMSIAEYRGGRWGAHEFRETGPIPIHPAAHLLHYASTCFEGFKAYRWADGSINVFRMDKHVERMRQSARLLYLPEPEAGQLQEMVLGVIDRVREQVPEPPGALYMRPLLFGLTPNIGAASQPPSEACLIVLASPVWDYFTGGMKPLRIFVEDRTHRTAEHLGVVKTGGNYAAAMGPTLAARKKHGVDQVLFCPGGDVQETGAANFMLISDDEILTKSLDSTFLHGMTRDSILKLGAEMGYTISERPFTVDELLDKVKTWEACLSGTAATLSPVGALVYKGETIKVRDGHPGPNRAKLMKALQDIQYGLKPDSHGWLTEVG